MFTHSGFERHDDMAECINRQCWIVSEIYAEEIESEWLKVFAGNQAADPYSKGLYSGAVPRGYDDNFIIFDFYIDHHKRYHPIYLKIPRSKIKHWVSIYQYHKYDYIFVDNEWHSHFWAGQLSSFLMVDAIGMREKLDSQEHKLLADLNNLSAKIDLIAAKYGPHMLFLSAADNIFVKSNFNAKSKYPFYQPELLIQVCGDLIESIESTLGCRAYGIFTQGQNFYNDTLFSFSQKSNHMNLNSLGAPFSNIYAIDAMVRNNLKSGIHKGHSAYFDDFFFMSLNLESEFRQNQKKFFYDGGKYVAVDLERVVENVRK